MKLARIGMITISPALTRRRIQGFESIFWLLGSLILYRGDGPVSSD